MQAEGSVLTFMSQTYIRTHMQRRTPGGGVAGPGIFCPPRFVVKGKGTNYSLQIILQIFKFSFHFL